MTEELHVHNTIVIISGDTPHYTKYCQNSLNYAYKVVGWLKHTVVGLQMGCMSSRLPKEVLLDESKFLRAKTTSPYRVTL